MSKLNKNNIWLKIDGFDFSPNVITEKLDIPPKLTYLKGEEYFVGPPENRVAKIRTTNYWEFYISVESNTWAQEHADNFIEKIMMPKKDVLIDLSKECSIEFAISLYYYDHWNPGFHFDSKILHFLSDIDAELDIDIYCLK